MDAYAIHRIHRRPNPRKPVEKIDPGTVFSCSDEEFAKLEAAGAVRAATDSDARTRRGKTVVATKAAQGSRSGRSGRRGRGQADQQKTEKKEYPVAADDDTIAVGVDTPDAQGSESVVQDDESDTSEAQSDEGAELV